VASLIKVVDHTVEHAEQNTLFITLKSFNDEPFVLTKEEEASTLSSSFTCLKNLVSIGFNIETHLNVTWTNLVKHHYLGKLLVLMTFKFSLDLNVVRV
jgi:hypothetical protein